jgi:hypothetical protein
VAKKPLDLQATFPPSEDVLPLLKVVEKPVPKATDLGRFMLRRKGRTAQVDNSISAM